jgi:surface antigen
MSSSVFKKIMMKKVLKHELTRFSLASVLTVCLICSGCSNPKEQMGTLVGAGIGGAIGSTIGKGSGQIVAAIIGASLGGMIGQSIGKELDAQDKVAAEKAALEALEKTPSGQAVSWSNPDTKNYGYIIARPCVHTQNNVIRRPFKHVVYIDGKETVIHGMAERDSCGSWHICSN